MSIAWSLQPLLRATVPTEAMVLIFEDIDFFRNAFLIFIIMSVTYPVLNQLLKFFTNYNQINSATKKVAVLHHAVEAIVLTIVTPIFTYFMIKLNFVQDIEEEDAMILMENMKSDFTTTFLLCICFMMMYLYELAARFESPRPAFVIHHLLAVGNGYLAILFPTTVMVKTCCVLVYFICFEALTFTGLFMYRIAPLNKYTPKVIGSGLIVFGFTRPVQVIWVGAAAFGSWGDPNHVKWQAILQFTLACVLTILQVWTMTINYSVLKRCKSRIKCNEEKKNNNESNNNNNSGLDVIAESIDNVDPSNELDPLEEAKGHGDDENFKSFVTFLKTPSALQDTSL